MHSGTEMERYTVTYVGHDSIQTRLLVPFSPTASVAEFIAELSKRLTKIAIQVCKADLQLRIGEPNGPLLDEDDLLEHVVLTPRDEALFAASRGQPSSQPQVDTVPTSVRPIDMPWYGSWKC
jgi:hypothetical protein